MRDGLVDVLFQKPCVGDKNIPNAGVSPSVLFKKNMPTDNRTANTKPEIFFAIDNLVNRI